VSKGETSEEYDPRRVSVGYSLDTRVRVSHSTRHVAVRSRLDKKTSLHRKRGESQAARLVKRVRCTRIRRISVAVHVRISIGFLRSLESPSRATRKLRLSTIDP